jgi:hypothetical protein
MFRLKTSHPHALQRTFQAKHRWYICARIAIGLICIDRSIYTRPPHNRPQQHTEQSFTNRWPRLACNSAGTEELHDGGTQVPKHVGAAEWYYKLLRISAFVDYFVAMAVSPSCHLSPVVCPAVVSPLTITLEPWLSGWRFLCFFNIYIYIYIFHVLLLFAGW